MTSEHEAEHRFAERFGFYVSHVWYIDTFTIRRGHYYKYRIAGANGMRNMESISWSVPDLEGAFAFRLKELSA